MLGRRVVVRKPKEVAIEEIEFPKPSQGQILIKTSASLISTGTELTMFSGEFPKGSHWDEISRYPYRPGYSNCGRIIEVGEGIEKFKVGDKVVSYSPHAEYAIAQANRVYKVPEDVPDEEATFAILGATVMNSVRLAQIELGESIVIVGVGLLGQLACQYSRLCGGFPVIAVDLSEKRLAMAKKLGATVGLQMKKDNVEKEILSLTKGRGADIVFEVTGNAAAIPWELSITKKQGRLILLSSPRGPSTVDFHDEVNWPSRVIIGTHVSSHPAFETPFNPWTVGRNIELFFDLLSASMLSVNELITDRYKWTEIKDVYQKLLDPTGERLQAMGVVLNYS